MVKKFFSYILAVTLLTVSLGLIGCGNNTSALSNKNVSDSGKKVLNMAISPASIWIPMYVVKENGWLEKALKDKNVEIHWNEFATGPSMMESFAAGQQDFGTVGDALIPALVAGQKNTLIASTEAGASLAVLVPPNSPIKSPADLKGKKIGTVIGASPHHLLKYVLEPAGVKLNEVELVNITPGDAESVIASGNVDAVSVWDPQVTKLEKAGIAKELINGKDINFKGVSQLFVRDEYLKNNPEIIKIILEQYARGVKVFKNNPEKYTQKLAPAFAVEPDILLTASKKYEFLEPVNDANIAELQDTVSFFKSIGAIQNEVQIKDYVDNSLINDVLKK